MKKQNKSIENVDVFFALVRAGLWEKSIQLLPYGKIDFSVVQALAEEQSVVGLVAAGLDHVSDMKIPKKDVMQLVGKTLNLEERNKAMNIFIGLLVDKMRDKGIYTLLVKGQGISQCYERPLWRACGDVDFLLNDSHYKKARDFLTPLASSVEPEGIYGKHLGMTIDSWCVELHGNLRCGLSARMDKVLDEVQDDLYYRGNVRSWMIGLTPIFLPSVDSDIVFVFTHFLKHFYKGGIGLRQICDWCRFMWSYRLEIDVKLLERRLKAMGLVSEWRAFAAYSVEYLGMPTDVLPLYSDGERWKRKAKRIQNFILMSGNFGQNRDSSYFQKYPYVIRKCFSLGRRIGDLFHHASVFPLDSLRFFPGIVFNGLRSAANGE